VASAFHLHPVTNNPDEPPRSLAGYTGKQDTTASVVAQAQREQAASGTLLHLL
jgi:hypothetical protein